MEIDTSSYEVDLFLYLFDFGLEKGTLGEQLL
jgi:hypothetical protein